MASQKRSIPVPSIDTPEILGSRTRLMGSLRAMVGVLNAEIFRLETTGNVSSCDLDRAYEQLAWAVDGHWENQQLVLLDSNHSRGFEGGVAR
ncbi:hypothetical protein [Occallatibacter savannae]|uniref:hypothetical protein n=1 Tax=Occallatibacter savannae TaxID=1002691 RepID=UPI000D689208|nr:hypothetical protein [Occallatibacter savannae]